MKKLININRFIALCCCCMFAAIFCFIYRAAFFTVEADVIRQKMKFDNQKIISTITEKFPELSEVFLNGDYEIDILYLNDVTRLGYVVDIYRKDERGYFILFEKNGVYELVEYEHNENSPFFKKPGVSYYPSIGVYIKKYNNNYYNADTWENVDVSEIYTENFNAAGLIVKDGVENVFVQEYKNGYKFGEKDIKINGKDFRYQYSTDICSEKDNNCANAAGLIMLNYYNQRTRNQLLKLPLGNLYGGTVFDSDSLMCDGYMYDNNGRNYPREFMLTFYDYMNTGAFGTMPSNMYDGFERLISEKGYNTIFQKNLSWNDIVKKIDSGVPIFITCMDYYFTVPGEALPKVQGIEGNSLFTYTLNLRHWSGLSNAHAFVAYGYSEYILFDAAGDPIPLQFLKIADGWGRTRYYVYTFGDNYRVTSAQVLPK